MGKNAKHERLSRANCCIQVFHINEGFSSTVHHQLPLPRKRELRASFISPFVAHHRRTTALKISSPRSCMYYFYGKERAILQGVRVSKMKYVVRLMNPRRNTHTQTQDDTEFAHRCVNSSRLRQRQ